MRSPGLKPRDAFTFLRGTRSAALLRSCHTFAVFLERRAELITRALK